MELSSAIDELAEMLAVGSKALERMVGREMQDECACSVNALLKETHDIAWRLKAIAAELRGQIAS